MDLNGRDELAKLLSGKVDTLEKFKALENAIERYCEGAPNTAHPWGVGEAVWWFRREWARLQMGIYRTTDVVDSINSIYPWYAAHVSTEDPTMVAYTPDAQSGESDRQLRMSLGRLIKRLWPMTPDATISDLVAQHKSDLDDNLELLSGEDIVKAYESRDTTGSCMVGSNRGWKIHPASAYMAPNIFMAVKRDSTGKIIGRCMVYHASEHDKRMIRGYGDASLVKKMHRLGYRWGTWHGAKFNTIPAPDYPNAYVMPYLDGENGAGSASRSAVALLDGAITCITPDLYNKLRGLDSNYATTSTNTSGTVVLVKPDTSRYIMKDALTGEEINAFTMEVVKTLLPDGTIGMIRKTDARPLQLRHFDGAGSAIVVFMPDDTPHFMQGWVRYYECDANRKRCGFVRLSTKFYPGEQEWYSGTVRERESGEVIKDADAVTLFIVDENNQPKPTWIHKAEVVKRKHKPMLKYRGRDTYVLDESLCVVTDTRRRAIPSVHDVAQTWDNAWVSTRGLRYMSIYGNSYAWNERHPLPHDFTTRPHVVRPLHEAVSGYMGSGYTLHQALATTANRLCGGVYYIYHDGVRYYTTDLPPDKAPEVWETMARESRHRHGIAELVSIARYWSAEANAIEAPAYLAPTVEPIPAIEAQPEEAELALEA